MKANNTLLSTPMSRRRDEPFEMDVKCELGVATVSHFCGAFRREFGMTPGEFVRDRNYIDYEN